MTNTHRSMHVAVALVLSFVGACAAAPGALDGPCNDDGSCGAGLTCVAQDLHDCHGEVSRPQGCDAYCADCDTATGQTKIDCDAAAGEGEGE